MLATSMSPTIGVLGTVKYVSVRVQTFPITTATKAPNNGIHRSLHMTPQKVMEVDFLNR